MVASRCITAGNDALIQLVGGELNELQCVTASSQTGRTPVVAPSDSLFDFSTWHSPPTKLTAATPS